MEGRRKERCEGGEREEEIQRRGEGERWQWGMRGVRERLAALHSTSHLSDLTLLLADDTTCKVHSLVLAMASPVFEAMLVGPLSASGEVALVHDPPGSVRELVGALYKEQCPVSQSVEAGLQLYHLAHKYQVDHLATSCSKYLVEQMNTENFPSMFSCALLLEDHALMHRCGQVLAVSSERVLASGELGSLSRSAMRQLLRHPQLYVSSELDVFRGIVAWGVANLEGEDEVDHYTCRTRQQSPVKASGASHHRDTTDRPTVTPSQSLVPQPGQPVCEDSQPVKQLVRNYNATFRETVEEFLPYVHFLSMSIHELVQHVFSSGVLTGEECVGLLQARQGLTTPALPMFVSVYHTRREPQLKTVVLVSPSTAMASSLNYFYHGQISLNVVHNFQVSRTISMVRISSTCMSSLLEGSVKVWDCDNKMVSEGVWCGSHCTFKRPVEVEPNKLYTVILTCREAWCAALQSQFAVVWRRVTFTGQTQCIGKLAIDYLCEGEPSR